VTKYFEIWSLYVYRVHPYVPSLTTPPPSPHNRVQNKHAKIFHRFRVLYLCTVQRVLKTHWDSRRLDWIQLGRCEHPLTLESDWTGLDSTRLWRCVRTINLQRQAGYEQTVDDMVWFEAVRLFSATTRSFTNEPQANNKTVGDQSWMCELVHIIMKWFQYC